MKSNHQIILETERLKIIPMTYKFTSKILEKDVTAYNEYAVEVSDEWPSKDIMEIMPIIKYKLSYQAYPDGFGPWLFIDKVKNCVVGDGGFKDPPNSNGEINIGYGIVQSKRRKGYAFEAATALVKWGLAQEEVTSITAESLKVNVASNHLLKKLGMQQVKDDNKHLYYILHANTYK